MNTHERKRALEAQRRRARHAVRAERVNASAELRHAQRVKAPAELRVAEGHRALGAPLRSRPLLTQRESATLAGVIRSRASGAIDGAA